jgi:hypothetical protein
MFYTIQNGQLLTAENIGALAQYYDNVQELPSDYEIGKYVVENGELVRNENYEAEQEQKERERIAKLYLTGADVERGIYQAKGMDFDDIIEFVTANPPVCFDIKALKIELKANNFYRGNPYVNAVGAMLGFTSEQLDKFFEFNDYTYLIPEPVVDNPEEVEEENQVITEKEGDEV